VDPFFLISYFVTLNESNNNNIWNRTQVSDEDITKQAHTLFSRTFLFKEEMIYRMYIFRLNDDLFFSIPKNKITRLHCIMDPFFVIVYASKY